MPISDREGSKPCVAVVNIPRDNNSNNNNNESDDPLSPYSTFSNAATSPDSGIFSPRSPPQVIEDLSNAPVFEVPMTDIGSGNVETLSYTISQPMTKMMMMAPQSELPLDLADFVLEHDGAKNSNSEGQGHCVNPMTLSASKEEKSQEIRIRKVKEKEIIDCLKKGDDDKKQPVKEEKVSKEVVATTNWMQFFSNAFIGIILALVLFYSFERIDIYPDTNPPW